MTDPLTDLLDALAPSVDAHAARDSFDAVRKRRRRHRRAIVGALAGLVVLAGGTGVVLVSRDRPGAVTTSDQPATVAPTPATTTTTSTTPPTTTEPATTVATTTIAAALLAVDGCPPIAASDMRTSSSGSLFGRTTPDGTPIQAIATSAGVGGPYAVVLRYQDATRTPSFGDPVDVSGHDGRVFVGRAGQGQISWVLDDGSEAYVRSRGLSADQLSAIATALSARPVDAAVPGFDLTAAAPAGFALVAETTAPLAVSTASTQCRPRDGIALRVAVLDGVPAARYAIALDGSPLPILQQRGDHVVMASSPDAATAAAALGLEPPSTTPDAPRPSFSPTPEVSFTITRSAAGQPGCTSPACRFVDVTLRGFFPGATVTVTCYGETAGPFSETTVTIDADGSATDEACYFGYPGERFWVLADGFLSPTITWPTE